MIMRFLKEDSEKKKWVDFQRNWFEYEGDVLMDKKNLSLRWWLVARK